MPPVSTPAIVLGAIRFSETSKIVRLATRDLGIQSAIARGALRPKSSFGASLQALSEGQAQLYLKESRELQTLAAFDLTHLRVGLAAELPRYAAASALAEVALRFAPAAAHPASYDLLSGGLTLLETAPAEAVDVLGLRLLWRLISILGFAPVPGSLCSGRRGHRAGRSAGLQRRRGRCALRDLRGRTRRHPTQRRRSRGLGRPRPTRGRPADTG